MLTLGVNMNASIEIVYVSGAKVEFTLPSDVADRMVIGFADFVATGAKPKGRSKLSDANSIYVDFAHVASVRRTA